MMQQHHVSWLPATMITACALCNGMDMGQGNAIESEPSIAAGTICGMVEASHILFVTFL